MNLFQSILKAIGFGQNEAEKTYETPKAEPRFKDLGNPESTPRKPVAKTVERLAATPASPPRKPVAQTIDDTSRRSSQDDLLLNPVTNPALWPVLYGSTAAAEDKPSTVPASDFSKAADDTPAPSTGTHDHGSSHSSSHDSGSSSSSSSYDSGSSYSSSSSYDSGGFSGGGGFDGGGGASFAPEWR